MNAFLTKARNSPGLLIGLGVLAVILLIGLGLYGKANSIQKTGVGYEKQLNATYLDNQNELSKFTSGFYEQLGIANAKSDQMDRILQDAVSGRYENAAQGQGGAMFSAMVEAYPDLAGLNSFDKVMDYVAAGRQSYKEQQSKLLDMIRVYETWSESGIIHSMLVDMMGYPSKNLEARIGTGVVTGELALQQMKLIVTSEGVQQAYTTGKQEPLMGATTAPAPATTTPATTPEG